MRKRIYQKPDIWEAAQYEEVMINPLRGSWRVTKSTGDDDGWFSVIDEDEWDEDNNYKGANDAFFDD